MPALAAALAMQMKWLGMLPAVMANQKAEMLERTTPFSGMAVGRTTSKAEMRSVATMSSRPPPRS